MALILRFVDKNNIIREEFVRFLEYKNGLKGVGLYQTIKEFLESVGLHILDCCGQRYDGAGTLAGKDKGLQTQIRRVNSKALYAHCASRRLNLIVVASCKKQQVRNVMEQIKEITYLFTFPVPRKNILSEKVEVYTPNALDQKLVDVCHTRWLERIDGRVSLRSCLSQFIIISMKCQPRFNNEILTKAESLLKLVTDFSFIATLVITGNILDYCCQYLGNFKLSIQT